MEMAKEVKTTCTCGRCGSVFVIMSAVGRSAICTACVNWILMPIIWRA